MPKVLGFTPEWLMRSSPGYDAFVPKITNGNGFATKKKNADDLGQRKTIANSGSEVFVAVGNEIRWTDLVRLKEGTKPAYKTLKASIPLPITRLELSPSREYLAVSTSHTVHVVLVPDISLLDSEEDIIRPKAFQVGPTAHVREESPVATILWHPLGYRGRCLVTITKAGVIRLWEINRVNRSTFSEPSLSIDLVKLANATSDQDNLGASKFGASKGFSPDSVDLEIASACFGDSPDQEGVHGWAPMTLWIGTVPGDVYALCPLLPSKWQLVESPSSFTILQTLTSSVNINQKELSEDSKASKEELKTSEKQASWLDDIAYQESLSEKLPNEDSIKIFTRPISVPTVPLLQGPFTIATEIDDFELSDMIVFSLKTLSESSEADVAEGLPTAVVCLLTDTCKVHVCLDLEGIVGRWLPSPEDNVDLDDFLEHDLIVAETIALGQGASSTFNQSITPDTHTDFSFFISSIGGVFYVSLEAWIRKLENELSQPQTEGSGFRLKQILESATSSAEHYLQRRPIHNLAEQEVVATAIIEHGNIGYMLLTIIDGEPRAAFLDAPEDGVLTEEEMAEFMAVVAPKNQVREAWQPPRELYESFDLFRCLSIPERRRVTLKEEIRLSPWNLELLVDIHRTLSAQTSKMQHAASNLFNRATRLQEEFRDQIYRSSQAMAHIDKVTGRDEADADDAPTCGNAQMDDRLRKVKARQDEINARYEKLRRKMASLGTGELSEKETAWASELTTMESAVDASSRTLTDDVDGSVQAAWQRLNRVKAFQKDITREVEAALKMNMTDKERERERVRAVKVPAHARRAEEDAVQELMQRNSVLVEAATKRLRDLGVDIPLPVESSS